MDERETEPIAELMRAGEHARALERTVEILGPDLRHFCMAMLADQEEAAETVHELLIAYHDAMPTLEQVPLRPFLFGKALELCKRRLDALDDDRRARRLDGDGSPESWLTPDAAEAERRARRTRRALGELEPVERQLLLLRYIGRLGYWEAAALTGLEGAEARRRVGRGLLSLRQALRGEADEATT